MFDFGNSNNGQKEAISSANGPVLITAGPGTGKTTTINAMIHYFEAEGLDIFLAARRRPRLDGRHPFGTEKCEKSRFRPLRKGLQRL